MHEVSHVVLWPVASSPERAPRREPPVDGGRSRIEISDHAHTHNHRQAQGSRSARAERPARLSIKKNR